MISPNLPDFAKPKGIKFFLYTWSGRIIVVNFIVFFLMSLDGGFFHPSHQTLLNFGAKDSALLAKGEYWRLITPIFVHIGFLHFFLNNLGLYFIGYQLEKLIGARWFLSIYFFAGVFGNICSALFALALSAGASGALFGLLGCGLFIERGIQKQIENVTGYKVKGGIYTSMVVLNVIFGFLIPGIDNAAHLGGLVAGLGLTFVMYKVRPNRLYKNNLPMARVLMLIMVSLTIVLATVASMAPLVENRYLKAGNECLDLYLEGTSPKKNAVLSHYYLSQALSLNSENLEALFARAKILYLTGNHDEAVRDFRLPLQKVEYQNKVKDFIKNLKATDHETWKLERLLDHSD